MASERGFKRRAHFLGTKVRALRKRNGLTLEDLSVRLIQRDREAGPSIAYLSMIENGKRVPSARLLEIIADIFQKEVDWFYDETIEDETVDQVQRKSAVEGLALEPSFLFSEPLLQMAIPELLAQTGTTGRQFAHLLIRAHQEANRNYFPDLERAAERIGEKRFPLHVEDLFDIAADLGLSIKWFDKTPQRDGANAHKIAIRSLFETPDTVYVNRLLESDPARLKYDLANQIAHKVLHAGDGARAPQLSGGRVGSHRDITVSANVDAKEILYAWRNFECTYFAAALLAPRTAFRQHLAKYAYAIDCGRPIDLTAALVMRRMSSVSSYPHWHYFDAYLPGQLRAVYRGNGIPLPWGNMALVSDPCQHWAVFRMLQSRSDKPSSQISILKTAEVQRLYCCQSLRTKDFSQNSHVLCAGIDLAPALRAQGIDADEVIAEIAASCSNNGGSAAIPKRERDHLISIGKILNIGWISEGVEKDATIICPRSASCPRERHCLGKAAQPQKDVAAEMRNEVLAGA